MASYITNLARHGDRIAYAWYGRDAAHPLQEMTYTALTDTVKKTASGLTQSGLAGKRIALVGETSPEWVMTYMAILLSGGVAIPMDRELAVEEIENMLAFAEADAIFFSPLFNEKFAHLAQNHPTVKTLIALEPNGCVFSDAPGFLPYADLLSRGTADYVPAPTANLNRMAAMLFTSGTTGSSKCVMLSEKNVLSAMNAACECVEFFPDDTILSVLPIHHTYELCCMLAGLNYGMKIAINDSIKHVMKNIQYFKPTGIVLVPLFISTMYKRIWDEARRNKQDKILLRALQLSRVTRRIGLDARDKMFATVRSALGGRIVKFVSGGAPLNPRLVRDFEEFGINIAEGYGITECSPLLAANPYYAPKAGSVGPAVNCCRVCIKDGTVNDKGFMEGEICAKGDNVMLGYYKNEEATAEVFTEDGWFRTGDIGYVDNDGYIFITGRKKYVIVLENGKNVFPEEIEEYLGRVPGVLESVVLGRRVPGGDEIILTAVIVPDTSAFPARTSRADMEESIRTAVGKLNKTLVAWKQLRSIEFRDTEFEKTTSRKIKRNLVH